MLKLTAAKLNLEATEATVNGTCSDWEYDGKSIQEWIDYCEEDFCGASKKDISGSGCIEALDAFNNSDDTGFEETPAPFDQPGPAQVDECQKARGNEISNYSCFAAAAVGTTNGFAETSGRTMTVRPFLARYLQLPCR